MDSNDVTEKICQMLWMWALYLSITTVANLPVVSFAL